jgi:hypothetical protein
MSRSGAVAVKTVAILVTAIISIPGDFGDFTKPSPNPADYAQAPVYIRFLPEVMSRAGTFTYEPKQLGNILFCIADSKTAATIHCVKRTPADNLVLFDVTPTERST